MRTLQSHLAIAGRDSSKNFAIRLENGHALSCGDSFLEGFFGFVVWRAIHSFVWLAVVGNALHSAHEKVTNFRDFVKPFLQFFYIPSNWLVSLKVAPNHAIFRQAGIVID
jgi:hypothetical protein